MITKRPNMTAEEIKKRNLDMLKDFNEGKPIAELISKYNLSHTQIYKVMHRLQEEGHKVQL